MTEYNVLTRRDFPEERAAHGAPTIHFDASTGRLYFSIGICDLMGLAPGDRIEVLQDTADPRLFGFRKTDSEDGFALRSRESHKRGLCFVCAPLTRRILAAFGSFRNTTIQVGTMPKNGAYWVITRSIVRK